MKKAVINILFVLLMFLIVGTGAGLADDSTAADNADKSDSADKPLQSALSAIKVSGGISAGYFYASHPGPDASDSEFLLSNILVVLSSANESLPIGFVSAFGKTSTPSVLGTPQKNHDFNIEYASLILKPVKDMSIEMGLLQPNSGSENTYTFNNKNIILGAIASQQPYNAYGARVAYGINKISLWGGYYKGRLDEKEYNSPDYTWEAGLTGSIVESDYNIYNYHIAGQTINGQSSSKQKNLFGAVIQHTIGNIDIGFNIDYWTYDKKMKKLQLYGNDSSIGGAIYVCASFGNLSIPIRLEYINQDTSQIYIESPDAKHIYTATISPALHLNKNSYIRVESAYVNAHSAFADKDGDIRDERINLAAEMGFLF